MTSRHLGTLAAVAAAIVIISTAANGDTPSSTSSSCTTVLDSEVCSWVALEGGSVAQLGATIPLRLIEQVPLDAPMVWPPETLAVVPLPTEAQEALGIDHMAINWEVHGHPPASFLTEHFDFHFYNIGEGEVRTIDCSDRSKPAKLPNRYALPDIEVPDMGTFIGLCVPNMGMHAMLAEEVADTEPFDASMMIGYYSGQPIFFEPMVSRDLLLRKSDFSLPMPSVEGLPAGVSYPRDFRAEYDEGEGAYRLIFSGFQAD